MSQLNKAIVQMPSFTHEGVKAVHLTAEQELWRTVKELIEKFQQDLTEQMKLDRDIDLSIEIIEPQILKFGSIIRNDRQELSFSNFEINCGSYDAVLFMYKSLANYFLIEFEKTYQKGLDQFKNPMGGYYPDVDISFIEDDS